MSFNAENEVSFLATPIKNRIETTFIPQSLQWDYRLLRSIGIVGYNSSGKTNLLKGFASMKYGVIYSGSSASNVFLNTVTPFLLKINNNHPTSFEVSFFLNNKKYRYGYKILKGIVHEEWLFYAEPKVKENNLYYRSKNNISFSKTWNKSVDNSVETIFKRVQDHTLFLSILSFLNVQPAVDILKWFERFVIIEDFDPERFIDFTTEELKRDVFEIVFLRLLKEANLGFQTLLNEKISHAERAGEIAPDFVQFMLQNELLPKSRYKVQTLHPTYDENGKLSGNVKFDLRTQESEGTKKFFGIIGLFLEAIANNRILLIDELDSKFHFALFETLIVFFNNPRFNPKGAQLLYTSHNTTIFQGHKIRRDQFYNIEKKETGESELKRFHDKKSKIRTDASLEKEYKERTLNQNSKEEPNLFSGLLDFPEM